MAKDALAVISKVEVGNLGFSLVVIILCFALMAWTKKMNSRERNAMVKSYESLLRSKDKVILEQSRIIADKIT